MAHVIGQLHFELDASTKLFTELTTLPASLVAMAICAADGLDGRAEAEFLSASTEDVMALVSLVTGPRTLVPRCDCHSKYRPISDPGPRPHPEQVIHRASRTGSASRPWMSVLGRQRSEAASAARLIEPNLASRPEMAISASSRASGAPRQ
jgi:hypothetical protein